jgi:hypothetical protein
MSRAPCWGTIRIQEVPIAVGEGLVGHVGIAGVDVCGDTLAEGWVVFRASRKVTFSSALGWSTGRHASCVGER